MYRSSFFIVLLLLVVSCSDVSLKDDEPNTNLITNCDCNDLVYDQAYNNFYLDTPRNGYTGTCEIYFGNGNLSTFKHLEKGKLNGELTFYHENGEVAERKFFDKNLLTGDHFIYSENGVLVSQIRYERGRFQETIFPAP